MSWQNNELVDLMDGNPYLFEEEEWFADRLNEWLETCEFQWAVRRERLTDPDVSGLAYDPETGEQKETSPEEDIPF